MKSFEMKPTEDNLLMALNEDLLQRNKELAYFYDLLSAQENATSIAIDGRWGSGKTFFVKQLMLLIDAKNPMSKMDEKKRNDIIQSIPLGNKNNEDNTENYDLAIYYDAWENDSNIDPVLSIIFEITKQLSLDYPFKNESDLLKMAGAIIETISGRNINNIIDNLKGDNNLAWFKEQKDIHEELKSFFTELLIERGNRLVVFIDELDRCKPSYSVRLLEQIKHYLCDDRFIFVFSVNLQELQHTIKNYYGYSFDACRYLDRFFDLRITLPPADKSKFYQELGLNSSDGVELVCRKIINNYHFELREITRYYSQVKTSVYAIFHDGNRWNIYFADNGTKRFIVFYIVPLIIGLIIVDISLYHKFIEGKDAQPLIDLFDSEEISDWVLKDLLNRDESFREEENKRVVTKEQKIIELYNAIFIKKYTGKNHYLNLGNYTFNEKSKLFAHKVASMLSDFADYQI